MIVAVGILLLTFIGTILLFLLGSLCVLPAEKEYERQMAANREHWEAQRHPYWTELLAVFDRADQVLACELARAGCSGAARDAANKKYWRTRQSAEAVYWAAIKPYSDEHYAANRQAVARYNRRAGFVLRRVFPKQGVIHFSGRQVFYL